MARSKESALDEALVKKVEGYESYIRHTGITMEVINAYTMATKTAYATAKTKEKLQYAKTVSKRAKEIIEIYCERKARGTIWELEAFAQRNNKTYDIVESYYEILLQEARAMNFDSYCLYLEKNRPYKQRFYYTRRKCFIKHGFIQGFQDILDDKLDILMISMPPSVGKTTLEKFFHSAICGWFPREANLFYSHSAGITKMYYEGMVDILTNDTDYCWGKIFPDCQVTSMNAALEQVNINSYKPFPNVQTATVGSKMAGKVRCSKLLLVDDVIGGIEEAVNKVQLDKIWNKYTTDARQRRKEDENEIPCKEIHIATRWSVHDVIGRLQRAYKGNDRVRTIAIPDIDPITGESNFLFEFGGFTVKFYEDMRKTMDEVSYRCLYKNDPIEREGILYESDTLMRYHSLPLEGAQAVKAVCDTKTSGIDYTVVPIVQQYDDMYYLVDVVCDNSTNFDIQEEKIVHKIISNEVTKIRFESNQGGSRLAENVKSKLNKNGYNCEVLTAYTSKNKATKIIVHADWIKRHVIFPANELITPKSEMAKFMDFLTTFTITGDNKFDDVPDSMAQLSEMESKQQTRNFAESMINPLWDL